jgi:hypothetical protein
MFYTYLWLRENGTPYYVGKGHGNRAYAQHDRSSPPPTDRIVFYIAKDESEAFENEVALIWYYGRKDLGLGCLRNLTDGGENPPSWKGRQQSEEHIAKRIAARMKKGNYAVTEENKRKISERTKIAMAKADVKEKLGKHCKDKPWSETAREAHRGKHKANSGTFKKGLVPWCTGTKGVMIAWNKGLKKTQEKKKYEQPINTTETRLESQ